MLKTDIGVGKSVVDNPIPHVECAVIVLGKRVCLFRHHGKSEVSDGKSVLNYPQVYGIPKKNQRASKGPT